ncbi:MAG TPA: EAL domain-containing protein [Polyangia bacterium]|nr:EAL domain-containing protein [Polyangia bacterium]
MTQARAAEDTERVRGRVLIVDDEELIVRAFRRTLQRAGYEVEGVCEGERALALLRTEPFDVVLSDIRMPRLGGLDLLKAVRAQDPDMSVILMTGGPALETAVEALERGALRYLLKPIDADALASAVDEAVRSHRLAKMKREALELLRARGQEATELGMLEARFERALESLHMVYQPIVCWSGRRAFGYEALVRSKEPTLARPDLLFDAAERLGRLQDVGRAIRQRVAALLAQSPQIDHLFVNLHPQDFLDEQLTAPEAPLSAHARRVVLEITERAALEKIDDVEERVARLRALGYRIAIDDLGAGYAGLASFVQLQPDVVKLDMALVRDVDQKPAQQKLVRSLTALARELHIEVITEGIETEQELRTLLGLGCDLLQGYRFARPGAPFPDINW